MIDLDTYEVIVRWSLSGVHLFVGVVKTCIVVLMLQNRFRVPLDRAVIVNQISLALMSYMWGLILLVLDLDPETYEDYRAVWLTLWLGVIVFVMNTCFYLLWELHRERPFLWGKKPRDERI